MKSICIVLATVFLFNAAVAEESDKPGANELAIQALTEGVSSFDPAAIMAWADMPRRATLGETIVLNISVENGREAEAFELESLDIGGNFGKGFELVAVEPKPTGIDTMLNTLTLEYPIVVAAGEKIDFKLELRATNVGVFIGEVDLWEGDTVLTRYAQCKVVK